MSLAFYAIAAILLSAWVVLVWLPGWLLTSCALVIVLLAYCSGYIQTVAPVRFLILITAVLLFLVLVATKHSSLTGREAVIIFSLFLISAVIFVIGQAFGDPQSADPLLRYALLFPLIGILGFFLAKSHELEKIARIYVIVSLVMALLAVAERVRGTFLVAGAYENSDRLVRDGTIRSIVFSEHPLVLSVLLLAAIPLVGFSLRRATIRYLICFVLIAGVVSTNSRGALIILAAWLLLIASSKLGILGAGASRLAQITVVSVLAAAFLGMLLVSGSDQLDSSSAIDASAEYRTALYAFATQSLIEKPWGWGIEGLPQGVYLLSSYFGTLDIAKTVDSELALAVFDFGWIGLLAIIGLLIIQLGQRSLISPIGQSGLIITMSGFYLALHAWVGLGTIWVLVIGLTVGASRMPYTKTDGAQSVSVKRGAHQEG